MVRRDGAEVKRERLEEIAREIQRLLFNEGQICFSRCVNALIYKHGLKKERAIEYLEILEGLDKFVIDKEHDIIKKAES
jgi:hypothetical protein